MRRALAAWAAAAAMVAHAAAPVAPKLPAPPGADLRRSGFDFMTPQVQAMQRDDAANPAMLWAQDGAALWARPAGASGTACAGCHGDAAVTMRGVAARYPAFDAALRRPVDLRQRIQQCRVERQKAPPFAIEGEEQLAIETYVALQSRGLPLAPPADARLDAAAARGERLFAQRLGQLDFSCAQCHDQHAGQRLAGSAIPQAHATGYPMYRLEWQGVGSLQRRLRNCLTGVRAEPFAFGAPELVELELHLARRGAGLRMDAPAVRP